MNPEFLVENAPAFVVSILVCLAFIKFLCPTKEQVEKKMNIKDTEDDFRGFSCRIDAVNQKVDCNDKEIAVALEKKHRDILIDCESKFATKDSANEIRTDFTKFENSVNIRFEKLDTKIDAKFDHLDTKIDDFRKEIIEILKQK